jgi:hypothetical protein
MISLQRRCFSGILLLAGALVDDAFASFPFTLQGGDVTEYFHHHDCGTPEDFEDYDGERRLRTRGYVKKFYYMSGSHIQYSLLGLN